MILTRMRLVAEGETDSEPTFASLVQRARLSLRRLLATARTKIPLYVRVWKSGHLKLRTIRQSAALLRSSNTLFQLIDQETWCANQNSLAESTSRASLEDSGNHERSMRIE